MNKVVWN